VRACDNSAARGHILITVFDIKPSAFARIAHTCDGANTKTPREIKSDPIFVT
jgi:hypothetical protein